MPCFTAKTLNLVGWAMASAGSLKNKKCQPAVRAIGSQLQGYFGVKSFNGIIQITHTLEDIRDDYGCQSDYLHPEIFLTI